jgi:hypothetical protein
MSSSASRDWYAERIVGTAVESSRRALVDARLAMVLRANGMAAADLERRR